MVLHKRLWVLSSPFLAEYRNNACCLIQAVAALSFAVILLAACAQVKPMHTLSGGQAGHIDFYSVTLTAKQFLTGVKEANPVVIWGDLQLPRSDVGRLPTVILVHGSAGVGTREKRWAQKINELGVATFVLDCFTGRGITDDSKLSISNMIVDAYRALELLSTHPRIDPSRIALMGFSVGGTVTLHASLKHLQRMHGPVGVEFAAYLSFYPSCNFTLIDEIHVSDRPIRIFIGSSDDYVSVQACREYADLLHRSGKNVQFTEYPGAHHGFDNPDWYPERFLAKNRNLSRCFFVEQPGGIVVNQETGQPFKASDTCVSYGATIGYSPKAHHKAVSAIREFLTSTFKLSPRGVGDNPPICK